MARQLGSHLYKQGYHKDGDLGVIALYLGQLRKLRNSLTNTFAVRMSEKDVNDQAILESLEFTKLANYYYCQNRDQASGGERENRYSTGPS